MYKQYEKMKDSGIEWLGEIPSHWTLLQNKYLLNEVFTGGTPNSSNHEFWTEGEEGINWVSIGDMTKNNNIYDTNKKITLNGLKDKNLKVMPVGTILYSIYASLGKIATLQIPATTNQAILGLDVNLNKIDSKFYKYWLEQLEQNIKIFSNSTTQDNISQETVRSLPVFLPSFHEQNEIVKFLDHRTQKIDKLIEKKERLIELLKEKRQVLINETVTKGLNPNVKMKDSGIEWIGEIPEHWEVKKVKHIFEVLRGGTPSTIEKDYWDGEVVWVTPVDLSKQGKFINTSDRTITEKGILNSSATIARKGSLILSTRAPIGTISVANVNLTTNQGCHSLELKNNNNILFYYHYFNAANNYLQSIGRGTTFLEISKNDLSNMSVIQAPKDEEQEITSYIESKTSKIDRTLDKLNLQIQQLKEYRQTLIFNAVTGKIDVR